MDKQVTEYEEIMIGKFIHYCLFSRQNDIINNVFSDVAKAVGFSVQEIVRIFDKYNS